MSNQVISLDFYPGSDTRVIMDTSVVYNGSHYFFGSRDGTNSYGVSGRTDDCFLDFYGGNSYKEIDIVPVGKFVIDKNKNTITINNNSFSRSYIDFQVNSNLCLFACHDTNGFVTPAEGKIYSCKIYNSDELIMDLIPCSHFDGSIALCDILTKKIYKPKKINRISFKNTHYSDEYYSEYSSWIISAYPVYSDIKINCHGTVVTIPSGHTSSAIYTQTCQFREFINDWYCSGTFLSGISYIENDEDEEYAYQYH